MLKPLTLKILAMLLSAYGVLAMVAKIRAVDSESVGVLLAVPLLSVYILHGVGIPGLLEHDGLCGTGWCSPTTLGWLLSAALWIGIAWLVAWGIASLMKRREGN